MIFSKTNSARKTLNSFIHHRTRLPAIVWSLVLSIYAYSKVVGYAKGYPSYASRLQFASSMTKTNGLSAIVGPAHNIQTIIGYTAWIVYIITLLCGIIWVTLMATKQLRGNEQSGRFDLVLSGEISLKQLTVSIVNGMIKSTALFFGILTILTIGLGRISSVNIGARPLITYTLAIWLGILLFMSIATVCSQLMSSRKSAANLAFLVLGISFALKAIADTSSIKWLLDISFLGWFEKLNPLLGINYIWLVPIILSTIIFYCLGIYLASKRELNQSWFNRPANEKPHLRLLGSLGLLSIKFNRGTVITWSLVLLGLNLVYGLLTKAAVSAISGSSSYVKALDTLSKTSRFNGLNEYTSAIFFVDMIIVTIYVASCLNSTRNEELNGYAFNILTSPISRVRYLTSRLVVETSGLILIGLSLSLGFYVGGWLSSSPLIGICSLITAGLNSVVPAFIVFGVGLLVYGFLPRISSVAVYVEI
jgi:ABC-2 type transport system permease protein